MKKACLFAIALLALLGAGCAHTHHLYNYNHWGHHAEQIFSPTHGELHQFHIDIDRVIFGIENYDEFEKTEPIYSK